MSKAKIENLMTELHSQFGEVEPSPQQQQLLVNLQSNIHEAGQPEPGDPTPLETVELILESLGDEHPNVAVVLRELLSTLRNIGV